MINQRRERPNERGVTMARTCTTCQHLRRGEIDRLLAAGEPASQLARDYDLNPSSLYRHRTNCLKLASSNAITKEAARGTAAVALLPSKESLSGAYFDLRDRIDQIVAQAQAEGSLSIAIAGLNSLRRTLDSQARLAGHVGSAAAQFNVAIQNNVNVDVRQIAERLIGKFDKEPELKARVAQALLQLSNESAADRPNTSITNVKGLVS
jgi:transposase-like protein